MTGDGMFRTKVADLPFRGTSHRFVGEDCGGVNACAYLVNAPPGRGPVLHRHPYDKIAFVQGGAARWTVDGCSWTSISDLDLSRRILGSRCNSTST